MADGITLIPDYQRLGLEELIGSCNERLMKAGTQGAKQSFGLGCALGGLPLFGVVIILYLSGILSLILAFIIFMMGAMVLLGITAFISIRAKNRSGKEVYRKEVGQHIQTYLSDHHIQVGNSTCLSIIRCLLVLLYGFFILSHNLKVSTLARSRP
jgi:hypothetical protein